MRVDPDAVRRAVESVADPELPAVTIGMLGMVHDVEVADDGTVRVELLPTFSGCPATEMIERDVVTALHAVAGVVDVRVRFRYDPPWTPDRIDATGRERLREFGIAPPGFSPGAHPSGGPTGATRPEGRPTLPLAIGPDSDPRPCPYCGSDTTVRESNFGPTPCRDLRFCESCQQPFEAFKTF
ncbi:MAG: phenylacetate-CoA oxygenase subunit PaaJ [Actinobacteria bacterium]|jgi:ring-1,2-phenylacetyl-CoA epoxidase subunit PaaD|nr:phenylacetate-CoA oxygenase subunit PaaJ [Actinomycetota bacterium]